MADATQTHGLSPKPSRLIAPSHRRPPARSAHCTLFLAGTFSGSADWEKINEEAAPAAVRAALVENWSFKPEVRENEIA